MIFCLARYGQTDWNNERRMQGYRNISLNEAGISFDKLITSPLARAGKSAEIIAKKTGFKHHHR
ncbi:MAG: histidine phosphatase family protein [Erysipelotrichaceae bacterium]|nr:histidine phosphatase family protein [Erysipelotrichaceae bacterium]